MNDEPYNDSIPPFADIQEEFEKVKLILEEAGQSDDYTRMSTAIAVTMLMEWLEATRIAAGVGIGVALVMRHPEWARAFAVRIDDAYPNRVVDQIVRLLPIEEVSIQDDGLSGTPTS